MCPATLIVARHGDAEYVDTVFSDEGGTLTRAGRAQADELAEALAGRRVAHVWCSDSARAVQTAEIVAARLGVGVTTRKALREVDVGDLHGRPFSDIEVCAVSDHWFRGDLTAGFPGGETGADVVARYRATLAEIADVHRGETVLVVAPPPGACPARPTVAPNPPPAAAPPPRRPTGAAAELVVDSDDWTLTHWGGTDDRPAIEQSG